MNPPLSARLDHDRDVRQQADAFFDEVIDGLSRRPKRLPCKYFYDARGSSLFEAICEQPEYYLTRAELEIMEHHAQDIAAALGPAVRLIEYGSGAGCKTRRLLEALRDPVLYVPVEISTSALAGSVGRLASRFPELEIQPVCGDFTQPLCLPQARREALRTVIYFPGSTIGNFDPREAEAMLARMRLQMGPYGAALIGFDLKKDIGELEAAYNDAAGITAEFTLNLLHRINRELGGNFEVSRFEHRARYDAQAGRIQTYIVSRHDQMASVAGRQFSFARGETMLVEFSTKYAQGDIDRLAARAGLRSARHWTDRHGRFSVQLLERVPSNWGGQAAECAPSPSRTAGDT